MYFLVIAGKWGIASDFFRMIFLLKGVIVFRNEVKIGYFLLPSTFCLFR
jgi:hypothetical protein